MDRIRPSEFGFRFQISMPERPSRCSHIFLSPIFLSTALVLPFPVGPIGGHSLGAAGKLSPKSFAGMTLFTANDRVPSRIRYHEFKRAILHAEERTLRKIAPIHLQLSHVNEVSVFE